MIQDTLDKQNAGEAAGSETLGCPTQPQQAPQGKDDEYNTGLPMNGSLDRSGRSQAGASANVGSFSLVSRGKRTNMTKKGWIKLGRRK